MILSPGKALSPLKGKTKGRAAELVWVLFLFYNSPRVSVVLKLICSAHIHLRVWFFCRVKVSFGAVEQNERDQLHPDCAGLGRLICVFNAGSMGHFLSPKSSFNLKLKVPEIFTPLSAKYG